MVAERSYSMSKEQQLCQRRRDKRSYSMFKVRRGDLVQGKGQQLHFAGTAKKSYLTSEARGGGREEQAHVQGVVVARGPSSRSGGAAVRRYPSSKVRERQVRW